MTSIEQRVDKLSTNNYSIWKIVMMSHLKGKDLWDYVISPKIDKEVVTVAKEGATIEDTKVEDVWLVKSEQAKTIMYCSMDAQQIAATGICESAYDLWRKIKENHEGAISTLKSTALAGFLSLKYMKNESIVNYSGRFENALGKLEAADHTVDEKTKLWVFSNSLPQHLKLTVQMFTMAFPEGTVSELISQLKIQHHADMTDTDRRGAAYHTQEKPQQSSDSKPLPNRKSNITCNYCKKQGHMWRECRKLKSDNERKKKFGQQKQFQNQNEQPKKTNNYDKPKPSGAFSANMHELSEGKYSWIVDSGASSHMTPYQEFLVDYEMFETPHPIIIGDGKSLEAYGSGKMPFVNEEFTGELKNVLWVPELSENLFSICRTMEQNCSVQFCNESSMALFYRGNQIVLRGIKKPRATYFLLTLKPNHNTHEPEEGALIGATFEEWHKRLGHCSMETVKAMLRSKAVKGMKISNEKRHQCHACVVGKLCRAHHPERRQIAASESAAVLHIDTVGPMRITSVGGSRYFVLATEEYSGYKLFETLGTKSAATDAVKRLINEAELKSKRQVKAIVTDNGTEYTNTDLCKWLIHRGIIHYYSVTYTPEQNGRAERANRTILNGIRTLLGSSGLPEELWAEALNTIVYTTNRVPRSKDPFRTRYELFRGEKPDVRNLKIFGQKAIIRDPSKREGKLAPRGDEATFVGYTDRFNTYRFYMDKPVQQVIEACDARFLDEPFSKTNPSGSNEFVVKIEPGEPTAKAFNIPDDANSETTENDFVTSHEEIEQASSREDDDATDVDATDIEENDETIVASDPEPRITRSAAKSHEQSIASSAREGAMFTLDNEPRTIKDAQESDEWPSWKQAMDEEIRALMKNKTWILVNRANNIRPIKNKWVFKAKLKQDGSIDRYKARLVAKGFTQIPNIDYKETYAPVASMTTVRMFLSIANQNSMHIIQFDVKTAFLYGDLDEELYMEQPEFYKTDPNKVCKLIKSLYGLKQAPRQWNKKFDSFLKYFELQQSSVDRCLYFSHDKSLLLAIYVDDGLAAGRNKEKLNKLITYLKENFELKVMDCESYLGFEITRDLKAKTLSISQAHYVDKILNRFGMNDCKPVNTPEEVGVSFEESPPLPTDNQFKELVGSLLYLTTCSRPDIAHAVSIASRTAQPTQAHWVALKRVLRYLKGTRDLGLRFRWENPNELIGYSDADYANDAETRRSTTGYCIYFGGAPIAWRCQRQPIITLSTTEAEYVAGCELVKEILPIRQQLVELEQIEEHVPTTIFIDNQSTVRIASSEGGQNRTKHIDIREKWLTEQVMKKKIQVRHISGEEQAADILTKPLYKSKFISNRSKLLTQVITIMTIMTICSSSIETRPLRPTDPLTAVKSDKILINGDIRYHLTNIFVNPCDTLFNYSTTITGTESLVRYCYEYFEKKHFNSLSHCKRLPTIGPDLKQIPLSYNCVEDPSSGLANGEPFTGKCDVTRRNSKANGAPILELDLIQEAWNKHKQLIDQMPTLRRSKRIVPWLLGAAVLGVIAGPGVKTYRLANANTDSIDQLANITELHGRIIKESTLFFEQYRNSVATLHSWAEDVEERLGDDPMTSRLSSDPIYRGRKANLVKSYMAWFDAQEKLLADIDSAASVRKIPTTLKTMLNATDHFNLITNLSTLFECHYRLEDKNMVLELDFSLPSIDEEIEVLKVLSSDIYVLHNHTDERGEEACLEYYIGPSFVIHNKTNDCIKALNKNKYDQTGIRGQTCLEQVNELYYPTNRNALWAQESCVKEIPRLNERVQITDIEGTHKIYCFPLNIEIENETMSCPNTPFILEGHANYRIENITHHGAYIDTSISRRITRSSDNKTAPSSRRHKRSPVSVPTVMNAPITTTTSKPMMPDSIPAGPPPMKIGETLRNITGQMNITLAKIRESIKLLPGKLNITRANFDTIFDAPMKYITSGFDQLSIYIKSIGSMMVMLSVVVVFIMIMPALELIMIGLKVAKVPANMWLSSARRVTSNLKFISTTGTTKIFRSKKQRWEDSVKMV